MPFSFFLLSLFSLAAFAADVREGTYNLTGYAPGASTPYKGTVTIKKIGADYGLRWQIGTSQSQFGNGVVKGNILKVSYSNVSNTDSGVAEFNVANPESLEGTWWSNKTPEQKGKETLAFANGFTAAAAAAYDKDPFSGVLVAHNRMLEETRRPYAEFLDSPEAGKRAVDLWKNKFIPENGRLILDLEKASVATEIKKATVGGLMKMLQAYDAQLRAELLAMETPSRATLTVVKERARDYGRIAKEALANAAKVSGTSK